MKKTLLIIFAILSTELVNAQNYVSVQSTTLSVFGPINVNFYTLQPGINYKLTMSGLWGDYGGTTHYDTRYNLESTPVDFGFNYFIATPLWLRNQTPSPAGYQASHNYDLYFVGDGSVITYTYYDNGYGDNAGSIQFELFQDCPVINHPIARDTAVCELSSLILTATGASNYIWYDAAVGGNTLSATASLSITSVATTDTFYVNTMHFNGCVSNRDTVIVTANALPTVDLTFSNNQLCASDPPLLLTEGIPSGGSYSGMGVSGTNFNPSAVSVGNCTITYIYTSPQGCTSSDSSTIDVNICTGINNNDDQKKLSLYPNPANQSIQIQGLDFNEGVSIKIISIDGKIMKDEVITQLNINVSDLNSGMYFIELTDAKGKTGVTKLIKE
jgi:hypothetical protein